MAVVGRDVAELAVADFSAADADSDGVGIVAVENAVGDGDPFAGLWILEICRAGAQRECVVARADVAVADDDLSAAVDVNAVVFRHVRAVCDVDSMNGHILATIKETGPAS